jgi:hypothetical protein
MSTATLVTKTNIAKTPQKKHKTLVLVVVPSFICSRTCSKL